MFIPDLPEDNIAITYEEAFVDFLLRKNDVNILQENLTTYELCKALINSCPNFLQYIPNQFKTYELCLLAVVKWVYSFEWVPEEYKTYDLCKTAVSKNPQALHWVPVYNKSYEICLIAVKSDPDSISWIPPQLKSYCFYLDVIGHWCFYHGPELMLLVPENYRSIEMYVMAVQGNRRCIPHLPLQVKDEVMKYF
jgi:hypothetical protein